MTRGAQRWFVEMNIHARKNEEVGGAPSHGCQASANCRATNSTRRQEPTSHICVDTSTSQELMLTSMICCASIHITHDPTSLRCCTSFVPPRPKRVSSRNCWHSSFEPFNIGRCLHRKLHRNAIEHRFTLNRSIAFRAPRVLQKILLQILQAVALTGLACTLGWHAACVPDARSTPCCNVSQPLESP
jgi:hypothetical protein